MAKTKSVERVDSDMLARFLDRIDILIEERRGINGSLKEIYDDIREVGMDPATVRQMVKEKALDPVVRQGQYDLRDEYRRALGLFLDTPLGRAMEPDAEPFDERESARAVDGEGAVMAESETRVSRGVAAEKRVRRPRPFGKQLVHPPRRERKKAPTALDRARAHLGEPVGSA
jgi:uncharacterized protein (UPF0335 family)